MIETSRRLYLNWDDVESLCNDCIEQYETLQRQNIKIDKILTISKGGFVPAAILGNKLSLPVYTIGIKSYDGTEQKGIELYQSLPENFDIHNTLIIDDIVDTGATIKYIINKFIPKDTDISLYNISLFALVDNYFNNYGYLRHDINVLSSFSSTKFVIFPWEK